MEVIRDNEPLYSAELSHRSGARMSLCNLQYPALHTCRCYTHLGASQDSEPAMALKTEQGALVNARVFSWFRRTVICEFGYVFANDMKRTGRAGEHQRLPAGKSACLWLLSRLRLR